MKYLLLIVGLFYTFSAHAEITGNSPELSKKCPFGDSRGSVKRMLRVISKLTPMRGLHDFKHHFKKKGRTWVVPPYHIETAQQLKKRQDKRVGLGRGKISLKGFYNKKIMLKVNTRSRSFQGVFYHEDNGVYIDCKYEIPLYNSKTTNTKRYYISMEAKLRDFVYEE